MNTNLMISATQDLTRNTPNEVVVMIVFSQFLTIIVLIFLHVQMSLLFTVKPIFIILS